MSEIVILDASTVVGAILSGAAVASVYFGALWLTVHSLIRSRQPGLLLLMSLLARLSIVLLAAYLILDGGQWIHLLAALAGFICVRMLLTKALRPRPAASLRPASKEASQ